MVVKPNSLLAGLLKRIAMRSHLIRLFVLLCMLPALAAAATVVEYYNSDLDNYFITADPAEQTFVDSGAVGRWQRTGNTFTSGGSSQVCRFYGSPLGPNSHFYTADAGECAYLKSIYNPAAKSWKFESNDFSITSVANGACSSGTVPVYRVYNNGYARGIDSNHRITTSLTAIQEVVGRGWSNEGVVMCAQGSSSTFTPLFVRIAGGSYVMGDHFNFVDPDHPSDEVPLHTVSISPLYISTTLVTNREYADYLNAAVKSGLIEVRSGSVFAVGGTNIFFYTTAAVPLSTISWTNNTFLVRSGRELHPVTGVRWFGAAAYANWTSAREGYTPCYDLSTGNCDLTKNGYRLPTEAEWEYAARGGQTNPYYQFPWGNDTNADGRLANWQDSGDPWENGDYPHTTPVGFYNGSLHNKSDYNWPAAATSYQTRDGSNAFGLYDMAGNVWEWVNDWYSANYYQYCVTNHITNDPPGPASGDIMQGNMPWRAMRGGTWWNGGGQQFLGYSRVSNRDPSWSLGGSPDNNPDSAWLQVGFRLMRPDKASLAKGPAPVQNASSVLGSETLLSPTYSAAFYPIDQYAHINEF